MRVQFQIDAGAKDITSLLNDRLLGIKVSDQPGLDSDSCELRLDNRDDVIGGIPVGGALRISLGWQGKGLTYLGTYYVSGLAYESRSAVLVVHAKAINLTESAKVSRSEGYEDTTLAAIVDIVAKRMGLVPVCQVEAIVPRADQTRESDLSFITRMALSHGATAAAKDGKLLVLPRGAGKSASGIALAPVILLPSDLIDAHFTTANRSSYDAVQAHALDSATGKQIPVEARNPGATSAGGKVDIIRHPYPNVESARAAANARLQALNRATFEGSLQTEGRGDIAAEKYVRLTGMGARWNGDYLVKSVVHSYGSDAWKTDIEISGGNGYTVDAGIAADRAASSPKLVVADSAGKPLYVPQAKEPELLAKFSEKRKIA